MQYRRPAREESHRWHTRWRVGEREWPGTSIPNSKLLLPPAPSLSKPESRTNCVVPHGEEGQRRRLQRRHHRVQLLLLAPRYERYPSPSVRVNNPQRPCAPTPLQSGVVNQALSQKKKSEKTPNRSSSNNLSPHPLSPHLLRRHRDHMARRVLLLRPAEARASQA